jgi:hypothetical protein
MTGRMPLWSFGAGKPASEPSPRNSVWSSFRVTWAASRMVKGRTRTVTEMEDAPAAAMVAPKKWKNQVNRTAQPPFKAWGMEPRARVWCCGLECSMTMFHPELLLWDARPLVNRQGSKCGNHNPGAKNLVLSPQFPTWLQHHPPPHHFCPANGRTRLCDTSTTDNSDWIVQDPSTTSFIVCPVLCARPSCCELGKGAAVEHHSKWRVK